MNELQYLGQISSRINTTNNKLDDVIANQEIIDQDLYNMKQNQESLIQQSNYNSDNIQESLDRFAYGNSIFLGCITLFLSIIMLYRFLPRKEYKKNWEVKFK